MELKPFAIGPVGRVIRGTFYQAEGVERRRPVVVLLHGFTGDRMESDFLFVKLARSLAGSGVHAVTFDFRGSGESDGTFEEMLVSGELADALQVLEWLPGRPGVDRSRLGLVGFSLGGLLAACAAARNRSVKALALLAPTTTQNLRRHAKKDGDRPVVVGSHTLHADFFEDLDKLDPLADLGKRPVPTLLLHGTADKAVPVRVAEEYEAALRAAGAELRFERIEGANHAFAGPGVRERLMGIAVGFFKEKL